MIITKTMSIAFILLTHALFGQGFLYWTNYESIKVLKCLQSTKLIYISCNIYLILTLMQPCVHVSCTCVLIISHHLLLKFHTIVPRVVLLSPSLLDTQTIQTTDFSFYSSGLQLLYLVSSPAPQFF